MGLRKIFYPEFSSRGKLQPGLFENTLINDKFIPFNDSLNDIHTSVLQSVVWDETENTIKFDLYHGFPENTKEHFAQLYKDVVCEFTQDIKKEKRVYFKDWRMCGYLKHLLDGKEESDEWICFVILSIFVKMRTRSGLMNKYAENENFNIVRKLVVDWAGNLNTKSLNAKLTIHALFAFGVFSGWKFYLKDVKKIVKFYHSKLDNVIKYMKLLKYRLSVSSKIIKEVMSDNSINRTIFAKFNTRALKKQSGKVYNTNNKKENEDIRMNE